MLFLYHSNYAIVYRLNISMISNMYIYISAQDVFLEYPLSSEFIVPRLECLNNTYVFVNQ
jgi:hypothetical protein